VAGKKSSIKTAKSTTNKKERKGKNTLSGGGAPSNAIGASWGKGKEIALQKKVVGSITEGEWSKKRPVPQTKKTSGRTKKLSFGPH